MTKAEQALAAQARRELALLSYPDRPWVVPTLVGGEPCLDVLIIGAGQSALALTHGLRRSGVPNILALDARPAGQEGVWEHFARMPELRTAKEQNGLDFGQPSLSVQLWFEARHGTGSWQNIVRVPRHDWMDYLRWYRATLDLPIENEVEVLAIGPCPHSKMVEVQTTRGTRFARQVVLATGFEGASTYRIPAIVSASLPPDLYDHACQPIDFARHRGKRIGILGHGASSFDSAVVALENGATSIDLCFRRAELPITNPHKHLEYAGVMAHWPAMSDRVRWNIARHMRAVDQPPGVASFQAALMLPGFRLHPASPWLEIARDGDAIRVTTPRNSFRFDHIVCATGYQLDIASRPELHHLVGRVALWRDRYQPPADEANADLGAFPYLGSGYQCAPLDLADEWIGRVHAFNFASYVSNGPHSTAISGHRHSLPRLLRALTRRLLVEQEDHVLAALRAYSDVDLTWPGGREAVLF